LKWIVGLIAVFAATMIGLMLVIGAALSGSAIGSITTASSSVTVAGIPQAYMDLYKKAATDNGIDWAILAAIGKIESDHGRMQGGGCAISSAGARGPMQFMPATWANYGAGGDICDPVAAIPAAARYLVASGAPKDYHAAILSYNHAEWYVTKIMDQAAIYRAMAKTSPVDQGQQEVGAGEGGWLATIPGTAIQCDKRIIQNVVMLRDRYHFLVTACYAPTGHKSAGEHPLGLAIDAVPAPPSSWEVLGKMARDLGWRVTCASTGCASQTGTAFRFIGWNGYPGHGDPAHCGCGGNAHIHLSWNHSDGMPARSVSVLSSG
jgi:hypothetical protein